MGTRPLAPDHPLALRTQSATDQASHFMAAVLEGPTVWTGFGDKKDTGVNNTDSHPEMGSPSQPVWIAHLSKVRVLALC